MYAQSYQKFVTYSQERADLGSISGALLRKSDPSRPDCRLLTQSMHVLEVGKVMDSLIIIVISPRTLHRSNQVEKLFATNSTGVIK